MIRELKKRRHLIPLENLARGSVYVLIFWSMAALGATGQVPLAPLALFAGLFAYSVRSDSLLRKIPGALWAFFTLLAFVAAIYYAGEDFLLSLIFLFFYLILHKVSNPMQVRDELQVIGLCFFLFVGSAVMTDSITFSIFLLGYALLFTLAMMLITFREEREMSQRVRGFTGERLPGPLVERDNVIRVRAGELVKFSAKLLFILLPGAIVLFLFIPRFSSEQFLSQFRGLRSTGHTVGYSEGVRLGSMLDVKNDRTVVLRVKTMRRNHTPVRLSHVYMRGTSLDFYSGRHWLKSPYAKSVSDFGRTNQVTFQGISSGTPRLKGWWLRQQIYLEPAAFPYIFAASYPSTYFFSHPVEVFIDFESGSLQLIHSISESLSYIAYSYIETNKGRRSISVGNKNLTGTGFRRRVRKIYLQQPRRGQNERIAFLASEITRNASSNYERAALIENYLKIHYVYSLNFVEKGHKDPLTEFLFERKSGHCEFFATAMVMLCRALGIPARIVNGFYTEEWNDYGSYFIVRQQDAHSWVEVWFDETGWISFDSTPPGGHARPGRHNWIPGALQKMYDTLKFRWYQYVIDFDLGDQIRISRRLSGLSWAFGSRLEGLGRTIKGMMRPGGNVSLHISSRTVLFAIASVIAIMALLGYLMCRKGASRHRGGKIFSLLARGENPATIEYEKILSRLGAIGWSRKPSQTPREFATIVIRQRSNLTDLLPITLRYYALRYRHDLWQATDREMFSRFLNRLGNKTP